MFSCCLSITSHLLLPRVCVSTVVVQLLSRVQPLVPRGPRRAASPCATVPVSTGAVGLDSIRRHPAHSVRLSLSTCTSLCGTGRRSVHLLRRDSVCSFFMVSNTPCAHAPRLCPFTPRWAPCCLRAPSPLSACCCEVRVLWSRCRHPGCLWLPQGGHSAWVPPTSWGLPGVPGSVRGLHTTHAAVSLPPQPGGEPLLFSQFRDEEAEAQKVQARPSWYISEAGSHPSQTPQPNPAHEVGSHPLLPQTPSLTPSPEVGITLHPTPQTNPAAMRVGSHLLPQTPRLTPLPGTDRGWVLVVCFPSARLQPPQPPSFCPSPVGAGHRNRSLRAPCPLVSGQTDQWEALQVKTGVTGLLPRGTGDLTHSLRPLPWQAPFPPAWAPHPSPLVTPELCPQHLMALSSPSSHICFLPDWCTQVRTG